MNGTYLAVDVDRNVVQSSLREGPTSTYMAGTRAAHHCNFLLRMKVYLRSIRLNSKTPKFHCTRSNVKTTEKKTTVFAYYERQKIKGLRGPAVWKPRLLEYIPQRIPELQCNL